MQDFQGQENEVDQNLQKDNKRRQNDFSIQSNVNFF